MHDTQAAHICRIWGCRVPFGPVQVSRVVDTGRGTIILAEATNRPGSIGIDAVADGYTNDAVLIAAPAHVCDGDGDGDTEV